MTKDIDILCVGEILIDFIGHQEETNLQKTADFHRFLGGSPTNVAVNMKRLGLNPRLVSTVGDDGFGHFIQSQIKDKQLDVSLLRMIDTHPTSVIFVSKTTATPDFIAYRQADKLISEQQVNDEILKRAKIFHTTCFALSKNPARTTIINAAGKAAEMGCKLSIDINYSPRIWPNREKALRHIKTYCSYDPLVKISEDDMLRLFDEKRSHQAIFDFFHDLGVSVVCLTLGSEGVKLSRKKGSVISFPAFKISKVVDATGAGDAFWSGFLFSYLKGYDDEKALKTGQQVAAFKLQNLGGLPAHLDILAELLKIK